MIYIGIDDTDTLYSRGTGRLAREIADGLFPALEVVGITRHQLLQDARVPCTKKNSAACISLIEDDRDLAELVDQISKFMLDDFQLGSDPGLCVAREVPAPVMAYGAGAKRALLSLDDAHRLAGRHHITLRGLGGDHSGVIGALAAVGLAAQGDDGRYIRVGSVRQLQGLLTIDQILEAGVHAVKTLDGSPVIHGLVLAGKLRPARREKQPVLFVDREEDYWVPLKLD